MERIEEFTLEGRNFIYIDLSDIKTADQFLDLSLDIKPTISKYPENSIYTITNIRNMKLDSEAKRIMADYMLFDKPYVRYGVVIGMDGIKKVMTSSIFKEVGRSNMNFAFSKEHAIEWLLQQDRDED